MTAQDSTLYAYIQTYYKNDLLTDEDFYNYAPHRSIHQNELWLSLANCVWRTRNAVEKGDWVMGLLSVNGRPDHRRLITFLAQVDKIIDRADYFKNFSKERFDNHYRPNASSEGGFEVLPNLYHNEDTQEGRKDVKKDKKCRKILLSRNFHMFEPDAGCVLPPNFVKFHDVEERFSRSGQGHRDVAVTEDRMSELLEDLRNFTAQN
jgi:hypothetical protein